tara:strand:- start:97 stop:276 length:180 start_codon:yes stop_codon:yes gene_type:complete
MIRSLEIAIDMLDRSEGTALYIVQKKVWGWSDKEYQEAIYDMGRIMLQLKLEDMNADDE